MQHVAVQRADAHFHATRSRRLKNQSCYILINVYLFI
jgi:hypothetical protein